MHRIYIAMVLFLFLTIPVAARIESQEPAYYFLDETPVVALSAWTIGDTAVVRTGIPLNSFGHTVPGTFRLTHRLDLPEPLAQAGPVAIRVQGAIPSASIVWDGVALDGGVSSFTSIIPDSLLRPGPHRIDMTVVSSGPFPGLIATPPELGYLSAILARHESQDRLTWLLAGIFIATALFLVALAVGRGSHPATAIFGIYSAACAANMLVPVAAFSYAADPLMFYLISMVGDICWYLMTLLLPVFFLFTFATPRRVVGTAVIASLALLPIVCARLVMLGIISAPYLAPTLLGNQVVAWSGIVLALLVAARGVFLKQTGAKTALIGLSFFFAGIIMSGVYGLPHGWSLGLCALNLFLLVSLSRQMSIRAEQHHILETRGLRLEMDLLKKHIQPHFLLNSLNSIVAWIEEDPPTAAKLVGALGCELRLLLDMAREPLVPLPREIDLCQTHLTVMGLRQDRRYTLVADGEYRDILIPPLIIHTLIENGLSHGFSSRTDGTFHIDCIKKGSLVALHIRNDGSSEKHSGSGGGTGLRYVKARLEEAFPGRWSLTSGPLENGWETIITITQEVVK